MAVSHVKSNTVADWTGTVTVGNSAGGTATVAATDLVRPGDWNSAHNQFYTLEGNTTVGSTASGTNVVFSAAGQLTLAGSTGTIVISGQPHISSYEPYIGTTNTQTFNGASVSYAGAFNLPEPVSASFIRIPVLMTTNSTTLATTAASLSASAAIYSTFNAVFYSVGTGGNSRSLQYVTSGQALFTYLNSISVAANGTQMSITQSYVYEAQGTARATFSTQYSVSQTNMPFSTTHMTRFTSARFLDIPFAGSLSAGPWWWVVGMSTSSATNSTGMSAATNCNVRYSNHWGVPMLAQSVGVMGTNETIGANMGGGSFSTNVGGTTNSLPLSAITTQASNLRPYFQLLRSA